MRILDNYIISSIIKIFVTTVIIFCCLYVLIDVTSQLDEFIDRKVPIKIIAEYYLSFFPIIIGQTASIACLISVLLTYSSLNNHNEIIVLRSSGLNFWQITKPALFFSLIISSLLFLLSERVIPDATLTTKQIRNESMETLNRRHSKIKDIENLTFYGLKNRLYFIDTFKPSTNELFGITIIEYGENRGVSKKIVALKGAWAAPVWKFHQCRIESFDSETISKSRKVKIYEEKLMDIQETPEDFIRQKLDVNAMNFNELNGYISKFANSGATKALRNLRVDLYHKIAQPFGNFVIVLMGLPFALRMRSRKGATFSAIGIAIGIGFLYYVANAVFLAFGKGGLFHPIIAATLAPILFVLTAILIIETDFSN